ncbi:MAG: STAS domain-containing protein [Planctomycetota bacterium]|jgi:anti-sigma B factor antagonist|nr:STAS domain-containing protein [Planctomycetota bacterium]
MTFLYQVRAVPPSAYVISVEGSIDAGTSIQLDLALNGVLANQAVLKIVFDLAKTTFISSSGLRLFMVASKAMSARRGKVMVVGEDRRISEAVTTAGMQKMLTFAPSVDDALAL